MAFLNSTTKDHKGELIIGNTGSGGEFVVKDQTSVTVEITCDKAIEKIEAENPQSGQWKNVTELAAATEFNCASAGSAKLELPLAHIAPYQLPTMPGDITQNFRIRWHVKSLEGETHVFYRTLSVKFKAPASMILSANDINIANASSGTYQISGSCEVPLGSVTVHGPFAGAPITASCDDQNEFSVLTSFTGDYAMTEADVRINHSSGRDYRAFSEVQKTVLVDLIAPTLEILHPTAGTVFAASDFVTKNTVTISGTCSEPQRMVMLKVNGSGPVQTLCLADRTFTGEVMLGEGDSVIQVEQTDIAGNVGSSSGRSVKLDTQGPGSFAISGVRSLGGADTLVDNLLTETGLLISFTAATDAVEYEFVVKSQDGSSTVCALRKESSAGLSNFSSCSLAQSTSYKIYAQARDAYGNMTSASNTGFAFTTAFPVPKIVKVYGAATNVSYGLGGSTTIWVEFDREITKVSGTPFLPLNMGRGIYQTSVSGSNKALGFALSVQTGDYAAVLQLLGSTLENCAGCIVDKANPIVTANLTLPVEDGTNPNALRASNIKVDAVAPNPPINVSATATTYLNRTASLQFSLPTDPDPLAVDARIVRLSDSVELMPWSQVSSGFFLATTLSPGGSYRYQLRSRDPLGNLSPIVEVSFTAFSCPSEFIYIHNPEFPTVLPFCVGQFEAKMVSGVARFIAANAPSSMSQMSATGACKNKGAGYELISNEEWNVIADLIARQGANWTGGTVGAGLLHRGDNQSSTMTAANVADPCAPNTTALCDSNGLRRLHYLPYNQAIWDFAGNAAEVINDADTQIYADANYVYAATQTAYLLDTKYGTPLTCSNSGSPEYCGFGKIDFIATGISTIWRGGAAFDGNAAGVFAARRATDAAGILTNGGFRCTYHP